MNFIYIFIYLPEDSLFFIFIIISKASRVSLLFTSGYGEFVEFLKE